VYTAKSAAALVDLARREQPILYWATKSSTELPRATEDDVAVAPAAMRAWMGR
jgi:hypothetical protein